MDDRLWSATLREYMGRSYVNISDHQYERSVEGSVFKICTSKGGKGGGDLGHGEPWLQCNSVRTMFSHEALIFS